MDWTTRSRRPTACRVDQAPPLGMDLARDQIRTIIWAVGYRPDYSWLKTSVFDRKGMVEHDGGVVPSPGIIS
jgi:putative flavoprotein involved in K+ transport